MKTTIANELMLFMDIESERKKRDDEYYEKYNYRKNRKLRKFSPRTTNATVRTEINKRYIYDFSFRCTVSDKASQFTMLL